MLTHRPKPGIFPHKSLWDILVHCHPLTQTPLNTNDTSWVKIQMLDLANSPGSSYLLCYTSTLRDATALT